MDEELYEDGFYRWTPRQREVLALVAKGLTNGEIAEALGISLAGAKWHVAEVMSKLGVESREDAARYWRSETSLPRRARQALRHALGWSALKLAAGSAAGALAVAAGGFAYVGLVSRGPASAADSPTESQPTAPSSPCFDRAAMRPSGTPIDIVTVDAEVQLPVLFGYRAGSDLCFGLHSLNPSSGQLLVNIPEGRDRMGAFSGIRADQ